MSKDVESVWMYKGNDGEWKPFMNEQHRLNTIADGGWDVREFFAAPTVQKTLPCHECGGDGAGGEHEEDCSMASPAPDVEALVETLTELCDEIDNHEIHTPISKTNVLRLKRKARSALAAHHKQGVQS